MRRTSIIRRFWTPLLLALIVMICSRIVYSHSHGIDDQALHHCVALVSGALQFASIVLVAILVYPVTYFRGATAAERVIASSANLALWVGLDASQVSEAFGCLESLYYAANIGAILFAWNFALLGVLELVCRRVARSRGEPLRVLTPLPFLPLLVFLFVVCLLSKEGGAYYFNLLLDGHLALFGP